MQTFEEFQNASASEKIGLVILEASKRLMGWALHSGSVYKIPFSESLIIESISENGTALVEKNSIAELVSGSWYFDREGGYIYAQAVAGSQPNGRFMSCVFRLFFSNVPVGAPADLDTGIEVEFLHLLRSVSEFGVELENRFTQLGLGIEGEGSISFINDKSFWGSRYERLVFENQRAFVYSWNKKLPITEAKLIYSGLVSDKTWSNDTIVFKLKDQLAELRQQLPLASVSDLSGVKAPASYFQSRLRQIYGTVSGLIPQNLDQITEKGYTLTGSITAQSDGLTIIGSGSAFLSQLRPGDEVLCYDLDHEVRFSVESIANDTTLTSASELSGPEIAFINAKQYNVSPTIPKSYMNRRWKIAGHSISEPTCTITAVAGPGFYSVTTVQGFHSGDQVQHAGIIGKILEISGTRIRFSGLPSLALGSVIKGISVPVVKINKSTLTYLRDYTYDAAEAEITLLNAEFNIAPINILSGTITFKSGSRQVTGTDTAFTSQLNQNSFIQDPRNPSNFVPVMGMVSDTELYLAEELGLPGDEVRTSVQAKNPRVIDGDIDVITCTTLGATEDGSVTGKLIKTVPQAVRDLIEKSGLSSIIDYQSFSDAEELVDHEIGYFFPEQHSDRSSIPIRDIIGKMNRSVFGALIQTNDFKLAYKALRPVRKQGIKQFLEPDILGFSIASDSSYLTRKISVQYGFQEYNPEILDKDFSVKEKLSENAEYLAGNNSEQTIETVLIKEESARIMAGRWSIMFQLSRSSIKLNTKMQGARMALADSTEVNTRFMLESRGMNRKSGMTISAKKSFSGSSLELDDLGGSCSKSACIVAPGAQSYSNSDEDGKFYGSFITDEYGMQDNDPDTFDQNLIW